MKLRILQEPIPLPLPAMSCPACQRRRIPYVPSCFCGHVWAERPSPELPASEQSATAPPASEQSATEPLASEPLAFETSTVAPNKPAGVFRLAHWSDLHLGSRAPDGLRVEVRLRSLLALLNDLGVDALLISGDLTRFGALDELTQARTLLAREGFSGERLVVVPGNHDIPRGQDAGNFCQVFEVQYPQVRRLTAGLWVLSLDSNRLDERLLFERRWVPVRGRVGREALQQLRAQVPVVEGESRLLLHHHHLARLSPESRWYTVDERTFKADQRLMAPLLDSDEVLSCAHALKVTATLHGHKHWYSRTGYRVGAMPVFNAGSLTRMIRPQFRLFDFRAGVWVGLQRVEVNL